MKNRLKRRSFHRRVGFAAFIFSLFTFHFSLSTVVAGQDDPLENAPPPLKIISRDERTQLDAKSDLKDRTKLCIEMMKSRLATAERLHMEMDFSGTFRELGGFHGLMDNALEFLQKRDSGGGKVLDNYKRIEIALRGFAPRIEAIRREVPVRFEEYIRGLLKHIRDGRTRASDPLFADSVVPTRSTE